MAVLAGVRLEGCTLERLDLSRVRLPGSVLDGCTVTGCKALATSWAMLREPMLSPDPCTWVDSQLAMGAFSGLDLTEARFDRCVLTDADFDEATLRRAVVDDCSLAAGRASSGRTSATPAPVSCLTSVDTVAADSPVASASST